MTAVLGKLSLAFILVNLVLRVYSDEFCARYYRLCGLGHGIICRERVGGVKSPLLHSSITLSCPFYYTIVSESWAFTNSTVTSVQLPQQGTRGLMLNHIHKTDEGVYTCTVNLPDGKVYTEATEVFLHVSGHAYFQSCPEAENGRNCTAVQHLETAVNGNITFDTHAAYRDGGACGSKQNINFLALKKNGRNVYYCSNFFDIATTPCVDNDHFHVTDQGEDKFDFNLTMKNVDLADAGEYVLEFNLGDAEGYQSVSIYRKFDLQVLENAVLLFRGEVLSNNSNVSTESLGSNEEALLCVISAEQCCEDLQSPVTADFLWPNGTSIGTDQNGQVHVSRGEQIIRLNALSSSSSIQSGRYCCVVSAHGNTGVPHCAQLM